MEGGSGVAAGRWAGVLLCGLLLVSACSSGKDAAPDATRLPPTSGSTGVEITIPATSASTSPTATPSTTTASSAPSTTTTVDPRPSADAAVRATVDQAIADFSACLVALPACDPAGLAATRADPMLAVNSQRITEWNRKGYTVIDRDQFRYVIESVDVAADLQHATATVCFADGSKLVHPGAGPDGASVIIDDKYMSGREAWDVRLDSDGTWRVHDAPLVGAAQETDVCPPG